MKQRTYVDIDKSAVKHLGKLDGYTFDNRYVADRYGIVYLIRLDMGKKWRALVISPFLTKDGYVEYVLTTPMGTKKHIQGQRISAGLWCKRPAGCNYVNHLDGVRSNNYYENLEWSTQSDNILHSYRVLRTRYNRDKKKFELY